MSKVIIIGGEGNGGIIASCLEDMSDRYGKSITVVGWLNDYVNPGDDILGYPVLGCTKCAVKYLEQSDISFAWAVHPIGKGTTRMNLLNNIGIPLERFATIIHPSAFVAKNAVVRPGVFVMANSYVGPKSRIETCCYLAANSAVGHHTFLGKGTHVCLNATIGSYSEIGDFCDICIGSSVLERCKIPSKTTIGANSLVNRQIDRSGIYFGTPVKFIKESNL